VQIKVYCFEEPKMAKPLECGDLTPLSPTLVISQEGESCARAAALQNFPIFFSSDLCTRFNLLSVFGFYSSCLALWR
jgi:hypothetical protein